MRLHIAFRVTLARVESSGSALRATGISPLSGFGRQEISEPAVLTWMPAASVYFDDPDGHSLEYICMLPDPPRPDPGLLHYRSGAPYRSIRTLRVVG